MGIHGLMKLLSEECPGAIKEQDLENYTGRKVAIDASMAMYQFLIAVRSFGSDGQQASAMLTNDAGEVTSHIQGMFNRTIKLMTSGIKPVYVFDGKPPQLKGGELEKRIAKRAKAETDLAAAKESGEADDVDKFSRRLVKVTRQHNDDCKELLRLMGVPIINAPCEAEAQCAELAKKNKVFATATEDMDALTFRTPKLLRRLTFSKAKDKQPIIEIDLNAVLTGLDMTYDQFVDLCILCGCDYCSTIKGIGPKTAIKLIKTHKSLENIIIALKKEKKYDIPLDWDYQRISKNQPDIIENEDEDEDMIVDTVSKADEDEVMIDSACNDANKAVADTDLSNNVISDSEKEVNVDLLSPSNTSKKSIVEIESPTTIAVNSATKGLFADENNFKNDDSNNTNGSVIDKSNDDEYETVPPVYAQARQLFLAAEVLDANDIELKWNEPDEDGLRAFLVDRMGFNVDRVNSGIKKLKEAQLQKSQKRLDSFFTAIPSTSNNTVKRKADAADLKGKNNDKAVDKKKASAAAMKRR
eukprot:gene7205-9833_t